MHSCHKKKRYKQLTLLACVGVILSFPFMLALGSVHIPFAEVLNTILEKLNLLFNIEKSKQNLSMIVWELRLPRFLLGCIAGAGFAIAGTALQTATRNPLAEPHFLGVSSGAVLGAVIATMHLGEFAGALSLPLAAFTGALLTTFIIARINQHQRGQSHFYLLMTGVAISFIFASLANLLLYMGDHRASHQIIFWMMGGLGLARWENVLIPFVICSAAYVYLLRNAQAMNALLLGDETAQSLGIHVDRFRTQLFLCSALLTAVLVAICGAISFIGLIMPHIARMLVGGNNARVLTLSAILGALFFPWMDLLARTVLSPEEIPVGVITGFFGGVFFLLILNKKGF